MLNSEVYALRLQVYTSLINQLQNIERKGKTMPYTSVNGHMFSFLSKEGALGLRLSKTDLEEFMQTFKAKQMTQHGRVMKEYVAIPNELFTNHRVLELYFNKSLTYVLRLKPKATKKK